MLPEEINISSPAKNTVKTIIQILCIASLARNKRSRLIVRKFNSWVVTMSRSQTLGRENRLLGAKARVKFSLMKRFGKFDQLVSLILRVPKNFLYLGLGAMVLSSVLDAVGIGLMIPFLKVLLDEGGAFVLPRMALTEGINSWLVQQSKGVIVTLFALVLMGSLILKAYFYYLSQVLTSIYREGVIKRLRKGLYKTYLYSPIEFFDNVQLGKVTSTLHTEVMETNRLLTAMFFGLTNLLILIAYLGTLVIVSWKMTIMTTFLITGVGLGLNYLLKKIEKSGGLVVSAKRGLNALALDTLGGVRVVKSYGAEDFELSRFNKISTNYMEASTGLAKKLSLIDPITELATLAAAMVVLVGSYTLFISKGLLTTSELLVFMLVLIKIVPVLKKVNTSRGSIQEAVPALTKVTEALSLPEKYPVPTGSHQFTGLRDRIVFHDVKFAYTGRSYVLNGLDIQIPRGKTVALVGGSGAGKSTVAALITRFYEVTEGVIEIDGQDIRNYDPVSLRQHIGVVSQDTYIFNASLLDNIAYGLEEVSRERVIEAAHLANAHEFISQLPNQYDTVVGDRGVRLSGGQRQRISIARAMLRDPEIMILDEATSALDSQSEHLVQEALERLRANRTAIVIAHRLATVRNADKIVVMEKGRIVEQGDHDELIAKRGHYWSYHNLQSLPA